MNQYKDSTILRFLSYYETIEPSINKGSIVLSHGILEKIRNGITKSFYDENKTNVDMFLTKLQARATELNIDSSHEFYKTMEAVNSIINPQEMIIENNESLNLKPLRINRTPYIEYAEKRKKEYENKGSSFSS